ncbi:MAG: hypothetical protein IJJ47_13610 [Methanosphaera sp.]|nr:hypothetical protein [Methanosphaera sp.]
MAKKYKKKYAKEVLKINENNNIDSIIEVFQRFSKNYNIITTTLDSNIQYQTKNMKITQTYTKTILNSDTKEMLKKLENQGRITLIIIDNLDEENDKLRKKIRNINKLENVTTKTIKQKDTYNTIEAILKGELG